MKREAAFTLLELLIVVIIIAVLVVIAIPLYTRAVEKGRATEAYTNLGTIRRAQIRYYQHYATFATALGDLDTDNPNILATMGKSYFSGQQGVGGRLCYKFW